MKEVVIACAVHMPMGCMLHVGQGQALALQARFATGLGADVPATTANKTCGSA